MIQFTRLRLNGFKSFVDKTELEIGMGLNGIVGPNGCGKSNLVEALRWVMGESSAKRMRGGDMDDVIFSGTDKRSARNFAEVSIVLDNSSRQAPAAYNNSDEIEIIRRIEREQGSIYKINGKTARARDVQMLFADTITGANSPSLVSQGHVTRLINAKPHDRRLILEESAGIAGLYARRHEAEIRLKAADMNLIRVQDILSSMENRLNALKRQARQASKYKNVSAQIRQLEIIIAHLEWTALLERQEIMRKSFSSSESLVAERLITVTQLTKTQSTQIEDLPPLRRSEADLSASLQVNKIALQKLEEECIRYNETLNDIKNQAFHVRQDKKHEEQTLSECTDLLEKIHSEFSKLQSQELGEDDDISSKEKYRDELEKTVLSYEERFTALKENAAETRARQEVLEKQINTNKNRINVLKQRIEIYHKEKETLVITEDSKKQISALEDNIATLESLLNQQHDIAENLNAKIKSQEENTEIARKKLTDVQKEHSVFTGEYESLQRFFNTSNESNFAPILDSITTNKGFEKALSRALGDSLLASVSHEAPSFWRKVSNANQDLPVNIKSLLPYIKAPEELQLALSQIGFVEDDEQGTLLSDQLKFGQSLVSANGTYWRWDGYFVKHTAADRHSLYLEQRNKLTELELKKDDIENSLKNVQSIFDKSLLEQNDNKKLHEQSLIEIKSIERKLSELRPALFKIREKTVRSLSEQKKIDENIKISEQDIESLIQNVSSEEKLLTALIENQNKDNMQSIEIVKQELIASKAQYQEAVRSFDLLSQQQSTRRARIQAIADERVSLQNRIIRTREQIKNLNIRLEELDRRISHIQNEPRNFDVEKEAAIEKIVSIEAQRNQANSKLVACEEEIAITNRALKDAERILGDARESRAHAQATLTAISENLVEMQRQIEDNFQVRPSDLINHAAADLIKYKSEDLENVKHEKDKLNKERDAIGPVNLRADDESNELEKELTMLLHERNDLMQAIDELRGGISTINAEARERLLTAFEHVNAHFQRLFIKLFGGGKAHLQLIDSDDPLGAGLEIYAQPPGKMLQSLSLLSGGEQTLTSIALIFAMFLTNPSPICVLDEIDAPLDDSNVDRVCDLLDEIADRGQTRFLIITHHRLSMARMHRLYGVTMAEKGVSQLVSVDLQHSFEFLDKAA